MNRNDCILIAVLRGWTLKQVGSVFAVTPVRVGQIAFKTVKKHNEQLYLSIKTTHKYGSIKELRKHKNRLIATIQEGGGEHAERGQTYYRRLGQGNSHA